MSDEFDHLFPAVRPIAALGAEERVRRIRADRWIDYPLAREALAKLEELIAFPPRARMPNLLIVGASGMGKTMIVEKFARDHPAITTPPTGSSASRSSSCRWCPDRTRRASTSVFWRRSARRSHCARRSACSKA
jgi:hypothetical protein